MATLVELMLDDFFRLEQKFRPPLASVLADAMDAAVLTLPAASMAYVPRSFREPIYKTITEIQLAGVQSAFNLLTKEFADGFKNLEGKNEDIVRRLISSYISHYGSTSAAQVVMTTENQINNLMRGGLLRGEAQQAVIERIVNKIPELADGRAAVITPTELHAATQFASQRLAERSEIALRKVWHSVNDDRTRDFFGRADQFNHRIMNGQKVALRSPFAVPERFGGFELLAFPGDPNGSPGNIINCRCVQTYERAGNV